MNLMFINFFVYNKPIKKAKEQREELQSDQVSQA